MRCLLRSLAVPLGFVLVAGSLANLAAQQPSTKPGPRPSQPAGPTSKAPPIGQTAGQPSIGAKPTRPVASDLVVDQLPKELEEILIQWEKQSALIKSLHGEHTRVVYNDVFEVEKLAKGKFYLETPDKGRIDLAGLKPEKGEVSKRIGKSGERFRLESDRPEQWICNGEEIIIVDEDGKSYEVHPLPMEMRGKNIVNSPLPFLFGMKAEETKRRFRLTLKNNSETSAWIVAQPRLASDAQNYTEAWIILDKNRYLPTAVKLKDTTGNLETVYKFENIDINNTSLKGRLAKIFNDPDPFHPDLRKKGYKLVLPPQAEITDPRQPGAGTNRTSSANGSKPNGTGVQPVNGQPAPRTGTKPSGVFQK